MNDCRLSPAPRMAHALVTRQRIFAGIPPWFRYDPAFD
jgi:hypothetical protein